jgi:acetolactate synthase small subunit
MLGTHQRRFSPDVHSINLSMLNRPGTLARVLVTLQHQDVNVENVRVDPKESTNRSGGVLTITAPRDRLGLIEAKLTRIIGVLDAEVIASRMVPEPPGADDVDIGHDDRPQLRLTFD